ncbi:MAG TPA: DNA polymerase III subunit delta [Gordonia sp. (in: high G+C Gram-positive bacteria)]|uniref:DNA polymerase III subunit delta n=1 Tax=unclassified Gordonia (in: high G+C Gram-positive bacteria) TaxID=2657482 RepID=UPI000FAD5929|nr:MULTISPECIES: DNA polymerase III subunit delta [unclassified Gordonia (in: high G+C Gram-positive bacteria)]RTL08779.1 MAG: DNA polymerase III subunit delta [Acidimicrobiia bacterium]HNP58703.1 DNA polymerase III subunit delta [Gordonia sp. (in: high G+C Gram-positive bacteria)]HRC52415.1 DNA polymerase III subunit delta [Gordonia sp. (in: high G+C Gram-positive bacteria)]
MTQPLHLLLGDNDFLIERAVSQVVSDAGRDSSEPVPLTTVRAGDVTAAELAELLSPSLFGESRVIVFDDADEAGKEPAAVITSTLGAIPEGISLVVVHSGGGRTKAMVGELRGAGAVEVDCATPKWPSDRADFVRREFQATGVRVSRDVVELMLANVGSDLRELASAVSQLVADTGGKVTEAAVETYYSGRAEVRGFEIADKAVTGDRAGALEALAWAMHHGTPRVILADALAEAVHGIARVRGIGSASPQSAASQLGMPPSRVKKLQAQAAAWDNASIGAAAVVVAKLNGDVKGQAADADYSLEHAVSTVAGLRPRRSR